jgi:O-acetyl-ADP-ribose deacetylase
MSGRIEFIVGDIARAECDVILNPCSSGFLLGFAGVNGALAAAAGPAYAAECERLPERACGADVLVTGAGDLHARIVLHAVSPIWSGGSDRERDALRRVHQRALEVAADHGCTSIALPAIGTGANRYPPEIAARIAVPTVEDVLEHGQALQRVVFVFQSRILLHDYLAHSSGTNAAAAVIASLRTEITGYLRHASRRELADAVDAIDDEPTLRAIETAARKLLTTVVADEWDSVSLATTYVRAAEQTLRLDGDVKPPLPD